MARVFPNWVLVAVGCTAVAVLVADAGVALTRDTRGRPVVAAGSCLAELGAKASTGTFMRQADPIMDLVGATLAVDEDTATVRLLTAGKATLQPTAFQGTYEWTVQLREPGQAEPYFEVTVTVAPDGAEVAVEDLRNEVERPVVQEGAPLVASEVTLDGQTLVVTFAAPLLDLRTHLPVEAPLESLLDWSVDVHHVAGDGVVPHPLLPVLDDHCSAVWPEVAAGELEAHRDTLDAVFPMNPLFQPRTGEVSIFSLSDCDDLALIDLVLWEELVGLPPGTKAEDVESVVRAKAEAVATRRVAIGCSDVAVSEAIVEHLAGHDLQAEVVHARRDDIVHISQCSTLEAFLRDNVSLSLTDPIAYSEYVLAMQAAFLRVVELRCADESFIQEFSDVSDATLMPGNVFLSATSWKLEVGDCYSSAYEVTDDVDAEFLGFRRTVCDDPHEFQVIRIDDLPHGRDAPYPGQQSTFDQSVDLCLGTGGEGFLERLEEFQDIFVIGPDRDQWSFGQREVNCLLFDVDGYPIIGDQMRLLGLSA